LSNFSKSSFSPFPYALKDYAQEIKQVIDHMKLNKINLIGHSAGGRLSIYFTLHHQNLIKHLVLLNTAGLKHANASKVMLNRANNYFSKFYPLNNSQKQILKETLKNIYNTDLTKDLSKINIPTLIIWGKKDNIIHISKAAIFNQNIKNSQLIVHPRLDHSTIHSPTVFNEVLSFLSEK
jgi:pimeloyl-ACP methyl ester carboxylesterase